MRAILGSMFVVIESDANIGVKRGAGRPIGGEQDTSIRFIRDQAQQFSLFVVLLDEGESAISDGARVVHGHASRRVSCRSGPT
jgi:hypothetical protein